VCDSDVLCDRSCPRDALAFATEPVFGSLGNVLGYRDNGPEAGCWGRLEGFKLDELEIKYGLVQLCEGLGFLHRDVKLVHRNMGVESVVINASGAWKLFGFEFCLANESPEGSEVCFFESVTPQTTDVNEIVEGLDVGLRRIDSVCYGEKKYIWIMAFTAMVWP
jgi:hypothetical protein